MLLFPLLVCFTVVRLCLSAVDAAEDRPRQDLPLYVFCGTGDHLWVRDREPVDSPATIDAMFEWLTRTYHVSRMYWRGGQGLIWEQGYKLGRADPRTYDWAHGWKHHLLTEVRINDLAVAAAKRNGMEIFLYTGLFEHGVQPDVGIVCPYLIEDQLRLAHPEWCPLDRWGERRCPGPLSFCYPEVRRILVDRYLRHVTRYGYDGLNFYTYVENVGLRYPEEFGFNDPIVAEFNKRFPAVHLRRDRLTPEQKRYWYRCRGKFVTDFLRELHRALKTRRKKLSVILDAKTPDFPQPWWGKPVPGTGYLLLDWRRWIREGVVDELWVQLGAVKDQQRLLDTLLPLCVGTDVRLTVRATHPLQDSSWQRYREAGVTVISCLTSPVNDLERYTLAPTTRKGLASPDWRLRAQTLADVAAGNIGATGAEIVPLTRDPHVLVRRRALQALERMKDPATVRDIEACLGDPEPSVRAAAAGALAQVNDVDSAAGLCAALRRYHYFQFKEACLDALGAMGRKALPVLVMGLRESEEPVREVCARALYRLGKQGLVTEVSGPLQSVLERPGESSTVRYWAIDGLTALRFELPAAVLQQFLAALLRLVEVEPDPLVNLHAAWAAGYIGPLSAPPLRDEALTRLERSFRRYGDGCCRPDAAYGWRVGGNALLRFHGPGRASLEAMAAQRRDRWLAWIAYQTLYVPQRTAGMKLVTEQEAVQTHERHAPPFPGWRSW